MVLSTPALPWESAPPSSLCFKITSESANERKKPKSYLSSKHTNVTDVWNKRLYRHHPGMGKCALSSGRKRKVDLLGN